MAFTGRMNMTELRIPYTCDLVTLIADYEDTPSSEGMVVVLREPIRIWLDKHSVGLWYWQWIWHRDQHPHEPGPGHGILILPEDTATMFLLRWTI